jgi:hypothetical protein
MYVCIYVYFYDEVLLCSSGWPQTHNPPALASQVLGLQAYATMAVLSFNLIPNIILFSLKLVFL